MSPVESETEGRERTCRGLGACGRAGQSGGLQGAQEGTAVDEPEGSQLIGLGRRAGWPGRGVMQGLCTGIGAVELE